MIFVGLSNIIFIYLFYHLLKDAKQKNINTFIAFIEILITQTVLISFGIGIMIIVGLIFKIDLQSSFTNGSIGVGVASLAIYIFDYFGTIMFLENNIFPKQRRQTLGKYVDIKGYSKVQTESIDIYIKNGKYKKAILKITDGNAKISIEFSKCKKVKDAIVFTNRNKLLLLNICESSIKIVYKYNNTVMLEKNEPVIK
jgi:hypothetical protein